MDGAVSASVIRPTENQRHEKATAMLFNESNQTHESTQTPSDHHGFSEGVRKRLSLPRLPSTSTSFQGCSYRTASTQTPIAAHFYREEI